MILLEIMVPMDAIFTTMIVFPILTWLFSELVARPRKLHVNLSGLSIVRLVMIAPKEVIFIQYIGGAYILITFVVTMSL